MNCCLLESRYRLSTHGFYWELVTRHLLLVMYPNSRTPEGKQGFEINHIVYTNSLRIVRYSYQLGWWELSQSQPSQMPAKAQPRKQACQRTASMPAVPFLRSFVDQK